jgi:hypothetical protein
MRLDVKENIRIFYSRVLGCLLRGTGDPPVNGQGRDGPCQFKRSHKPAKRQGYVKVRMSPALPHVMTRNSVTKYGSATSPSRVVKECLKAKIHVLLVVTVKKGQARLIGYQINRYASVVRHYDRVLNDAGGLFPIDLDQLEGVTM